MSGRGEISFVNGDRFEGEFLNNGREGKGKYIPRQPNLEGLLYF